MSSEQPPPGTPGEAPPPLGPPPDWTPGPPEVLAAPARPRRTLLLAVGAAVLVIGLAVAVPVAVGALEDEPPDLSAVETFGQLRTDHTDEDVTYDQSPPAGGPHAGTWLDCGAYDVPVREENAVHDLEHGTVWISYDPDLDEADVARLEEQLPQNGIMAPYPGLDVPVVVTVWETQLRLDGADDPRLGLFIERYGAGETAPEPFASCAGGTTDPAGGTATTT